MYDWVHNIPRAVGHTTAAARSGATVMVPTMRQKSTVLSCCGGARAMAFAEAERGREFTGPVVFDTNTVQIMVSTMNAEILRLKELAGE